MLNFKDKMVEEFLEIAGISYVAEQYYTKATEGEVKLATGEFLIINTDKYPIPKRVVMQHSKEYLTVESAKHRLDSVLFVSEHGPYDLNNTLPSVIKGLEERAWYCSHGLLIPEFDMTMSEIIDLIPVAGRKSVKYWNAALLKQMDTPKVIKDMFKLDEQGVPMMMNSTQYNIPESVRDYIQAKIEMSGV